MIRRLAPLCLLAWLAACSSSPPPVFPLLNYSYLPPIVLKVASISVVNKFVPTPAQANLLDQAPVQPAKILLDMLNHRMAASGAPGLGTVTIQNASIDQAGANLVGTMVVDVNVTGPNGAIGNAEAVVSAKRTAPDQGDQAGMQTALYGITKQLMDNMNVQLQYQIQHNVGSFVLRSATFGSANEGFAPAATSSIIAAPLAAPVSPAPLPETSAAPHYLPGAAPPLH